MLIGHYIFVLVDATKLQEGYYVLILCFHHYFVGIDEVFGVMHYVGSAACKGKEQRHQKLVSLLLRVAVFKAAEENLSLIFDFHVTFTNFGSIKNNTDFVRSTAKQGTALF